MSTGTYAKIQGIKFDALEGIQIVVDSNQKDVEAAGRYAQTYADENIIWIIIPCKYTIT